MKILEALYEISQSKGDAIIFEDEINGDISYRDFEIASGKLYRYLLSLNLPKERIAVIRVKRSYRTFIAIAGALKAAVPYVIIGDTSPKEYIEQVYEECEPIITIDDDLMDKALKCEYLQGFRSRELHDLALVVYSTGSSGFFKGSMQEYGIIEKMYIKSSMGRELHKEAAQALQNMSFFFLAGFYSAASIEDLVDVIVYQSKIIIIGTENANNTDYLIDAAEKNKVYTIEATPKTLPDFVKKSASFIKEYYVCYEIFPCKYSSDYTIYNGYGLSECCGVLCFKEIEKDYDITPVGKPVPGFEVKLLDKDNKRTKTNVIGELCFVPQYFRGYIKRMDLYRKAYHDGYFHTGDMGYYNDIGDIVIIGRKKDIRETENGFIVPIYISNAIRKQFPDISNCYVKIFDDEAVPTVVAYYISENEHTIEEINSKISGTIAPYSLPTHAVKLDKFEYFYSGKINGNLFPKP